MSYLTTKMMIIMKKQLVKNNKETAMMKKFIKYSLLYPIAFSLVSSVSLNLQASSIEKLINDKCADCHEKNGNSKDPHTPIIASMSKAYFIEAMESYGKNQRPAKKLSDKKITMKDVAKKLSKDDIENLADYFSKQKFSATKQDFDKALAKKGKKLHKKYCDKCHSENATSAEDDAGILAGQPSAYIKYSLDNYANGKREMGDKMAKKFKKMNKKYGADALEQLTHFYASLQ